jgi:hypothetical protein
MRWIGGLFVIAVGAGVFTLPHWLPDLAPGVTVTPETFVRAGQVGGAIMGLGVVALIIGLVRRR